MTSLEERVAREAVDALFADLRDRRFLKWLFSEQPTSIVQFADGSWLDSLDTDVQQDIREAWQGIIAAAIRSMGERG